MHQPGTREQFEEALAETGIPLERFTPIQALELIFRCFGDDVCSGWIFVSWQAVTRWGEEEFGFQFSVNAQVLDRDPNEWKPHCSFEWLFKFGPKAIVGEYDASWRRWLGGEVSVGDFLASIESSHPSRAWGRSEAAGVAILWDCPTWTGDPLFDCWGVRNPERPILTLTEEEWLASDDVGLLASWFVQEWSGEEEDLRRLMHRYCLATARKIWKLLPLEASRTGIEVAERHLDGLASSEEFGLAEYQSEGASFYLDTDESVLKYDDPTIQADMDRYHAEKKADQLRFAAEIDAIPPDDLRKFVPRMNPDEPLSTRNLLMKASYFANNAMYGADHRSRNAGLDRYRWFYSVDQFREMIGNPFRRG